MTFVYFPFVYLLYFQKKRIWSETFRQGCWFFAFIVTPGPAVKWKLLQDVTWPVRDKKQYGWCNLIWFRYLKSQIKFIVCVNCSGLAQTFRDVFPWCRWKIHRVGWITKTSCPLIDINDSCCTSLRASRLNVSWRWSKATSNNSLHPWKIIYVACSIRAGTFGN